MHVFKPVIQSVIDFYRPSVIVLQVSFIGIEILLFCFGSLRIHLCWRQSQRDIAFRWVVRESNWKLTLSGNNDQRKKSLLRSVSLTVNKPSRVVISKERMSAIDLRMWCWFFLVRRRLIGKWSLGLLQPQCERTRVSWFVSPQLSFSFRCRSSSLPVFSSKFVLPGMLNFGR